MLGANELSSRRRVPVGCAISFLDARARSSRARAPRCLTRFSAGNRRRRASSPRPRSRRHEGSQHDDPHVRLLRRSVRTSDIPSEFRHLQVGEDDVEWLRARERERLRAITGGDDPCPSFSSDSGDKLANSPSSSATKNATGQRRCARLQGEYGPPSGWLSPSRLPPCCSVIRRATASLRPVPRVRVVTKGSKMLAIRGRDPWPVVTHEIEDRVALDAGPRPSFAGLERIVDQVVERARAGPRRPRGSVVRNRYFHAALASSSRSREREVDEPARRSPCASIGPSRTKSRAEVVSTRGAPPPHDALRLGARFALEVL